MKSPQSKKLTGKELKDFLVMQKAEVEGVIIYKKLSVLSADTKNAKLLDLLSSEESRHYKILKGYTRTDVRAGRLKIVRVVFSARVFGLTFALKLMERGENRAGAHYALYNKRFPDVAAIAMDENSHEEKLIDMLFEEKLNYMGSVVLGLNDALVELTGALVGFTFALTNSRLIALIGLITGISAALSMAASEYLSTKAEGGSNNAVKASVYTGITYLVTVAVLVGPYFLLSNPYISLAVMFSLALAIIALFNYYYSVVKDESFKARFLEMAALSAVVSGVSFFFGLILKHYTGLNL
jgi:VIT1/CCC1 family predicted Fe2+/Mn2+ transporter